MSEWYYIWLALGITWGVLGGYTLMLNRRRIAAERAVRGLGSEGDST
jgi:CcmD family protein